MKAIALDDMLAEAHASLAFHFKFCDERDWPGAEKEFKRAIELNPNYATAHQWYAYNLAAMGRMDEAIAEIKQARDLDPLSININTDVGEILYFARQYDQAIAVYHNSLEMDPDFGVAHYLLAFAYEQKQMYEEAIVEAQKAIALYGNDKPWKGWLGRAYAAAGKKDEAVKILHELEALGGKTEAQKANLALSIASIYAGLGDNDHAFEWFERLYRLRNYNIIYMKMDPKYDSLRSDPRFADLLRRMGLAPQ
jgi:tetratricopeptide (TPR) repeat protein